MAASFPGAVKSFSAVVNGVTKLVAALFNSPYDEITAIETELGTDPAGSLSDVKTRLAVFLNNDGTPKNMLGAWVDKSGGYGAQQAATDGFVIGFGTPLTEVASIKGYTDANADPTALRWHQGYIASTMCLFMPVKKSDYWKVTINNLTLSSLYWIPSGS